METAGEQVRALGLDRPVDSLDDAALRTRAVALCRLIGHLEAALAGVAHALAVRGVPAADGEFDAAAWLVRHGRLSRARGRAAQSLGAGLASSCELAGAVAAGRVTAEAAALVLAARNPRTEAAWRRDEALLVEAAERHGPDDLRRVLRHWVAAADPDGPDPGADPERNTASLGMVGGRGLLRADLDAESAAVVAEALAEVGDELWRAADEETRLSRTAARWRAEALVELVRRGRSADPAAGRAARPLVTVVVDLPQLRSPRGRVVELPTGEAVPAESVRRLACDTTVAGVVLGPGREPLAAGRAHRLPTAAQARAVGARDRGCGLAHCNSPPWLCEIHHIRHWADGGPTDVSNLLALCRRHHRLVHEGGHAIERLPDGGFGLRPRHARPRAAEAA